mgnify:CR=1 FL=1
MIYNATNILGYASKFMFFLFSALEFGFEIVTGFGYSN